jgi:uncharacterized iron-regulated membrane protein
LSTTVDPSTRASHPPGAWVQLRPLVLRLHFYAGVLVAPFLLVVCLTGLAYVFSPQLNDLVYAEELLSADPTAPARPLEVQVAAAEAAAPGATLHSVVVPSDPARTTSVVFDVSGLPEDTQHTVYVDPATGLVRGAHDTWFAATPLQTTLDGLHRHLLLGEPGRVYSEMAASWLPVLVIGGLALWIGRRRSRRRTLVLPPLGAPAGRARIRGWHATTAMWMLVGLAFISVTGLTWSTYAGQRFTAVITSLQGSEPELAVENVPAPPGAVPIGLDEVVDRARAAGLQDRLSIVVPAEPGAPFQVSENADTWPVQRDQVALHPYTGAVTDTVVWADHPPLAQLSDIGILAHMGLLFGLPNQLALAALAVGLICVLFWGYRMAWLRRPTRGSLRLAAPGPRGTLSALSQPIGFAVATAAVAAGWLMPVFGVTLLAFLVLDGLLGTFTRRRGMSAEPPGRRRPRDAA